MVTYIKGRGDRNLRDLVDLESGVISREVYVNEDIYARNSSRSTGVPGSSWATRAR